MIAVVIALLFALTACQTQGELPACASNCVVIVVGGEQVRGGNSPAPTATVPLIP